MARCRVIFDNVVSRDLEVGRLLLQGQRVEEE
jgi:hypothetical protein